MSFAIHWKSKITGFQGNGENCLTFSQAQKYIKHLNKNYNDIEHYMVGQTKKN
jgi:hypothetical protein